MGLEDRIMKKLADLSFFQITVKADIEIDGAVHKDVLQKNNDSILTPENWAEKKDVFFRQRMGSYKDSYSIKEKISLELKKIDILPLSCDDYKVLAIKYKDHLNAQKYVRGKEKTITSYQWQGDPNKELPELLNLMVNRYKLIAPETTLKQFKAVFSEQTIDIGFHPIKWHDDNSTELLYFIDCLESSCNVKGNPNRADYKRMVACFVQSDGKKFTGKWKQLKNQLFKLASNKRALIDELIRNF